MERLTARDGLSVEQFFATAVSEKIAVLEAEDYIGKQAVKASDEAFLEALSQIHDVPVTESWNKMP